MKNILAKLTTLFTLCLITLLPFNLKAQNSWWEQTTQKYIDKQQRQKGQSLAEDEFFSRNFTKGTSKFA